VVQLAPLMTSRWGNSRTCAGIASLDLQILGGRLATIADNFEFHLLALVERAEPGPFHGRDMDEHVLTSTLRLNEAVAFGRVEPLDCSSRHPRSPESLTCPALSTPSSRGGCTVWRPGPTIICLACHPCVWSIAGVLPCFAVLGCGGRPQPARRCS